MEVVKVITEDLLDKFRSKRDQKLCSLKIVIILNNSLYIVHYFLPPLSKCPLHFLRKALEGKKKVKYSAILNKDAQAKGSNHHRYSQVRRAIC